ncbi:nuclear speckle splicing regulatory protein 1 [Drosophila subpulchrella]|uniref:nuclear speckle splicing regulatory protein 1 n=1 Tax=Drosophila subpulchrella TaxID=1486046 RepID=UPI0018A136B4|nr:nuclear speckle splicing regulatory protein 1 [Drosophila subpulchrella]
MSKQQYGLIIPGQQKKAPAKPAVKPAIFDESSASESDDDRNAPQLKPKTSGVTSGPSLMERRVARRQQEKALAEDPTIFQYDELYDDMDSKREEAKQSKSQEPRKPKYIGRLMEHAERRKLEKELRIERQVQKDREAEGEMYKDKDTYVTAAYRKKLESIRQMQEQEQRDEYLEAIGDVTKQKDLGGFYRHLYEQKMGGPAQPDEVQPKTAPSTDEVSYKPIKAEAAKHRSYRQRRSSEEEEQAKALTAQDPEPTPSTNQTESKPAQAHLANNIDADSDFSIDDSSDEEEEKEKEKDKVKDKDKQQQSQGKKKDKPQEKLEPTKAKEPEASEKQSPSKKENSDAELDEKNLPVPTVTKPPVDRTLIWRKRTVGEVFEAALARYQERKLARQG